MAVIAYALDGESPELSGVGSAIFSLIKPTLDTGRKRAANGKQGGSKTQANAKQTASEKEKEKEKEKEGEKEKENDSSISPPKRPPSPLDAAMDDFAKARKAMKKPLTEKARALTLQELEKLAPGDEAMKIAILNQSIQRGWQGVFPLKEDEQRKPKTKSHLPPVPGPLEGGDDLDRLLRIVGVSPDD